MSEIVLFGGASNLIHPIQDSLPAYLQNEDLRRELALYNDDVPSLQQHPSLSIKGKVFTLKKDGESKRLMRTEDEVLQSIQVTVVRANPNYRVYYEGEYEEGAEGEAARPTCYSNDGVAPASDARNAQSNKCAICPNAVWGTGARGEGTACSVKTRVAIVAPELLPSGKAEPTLLAIPAGSRRNFSDFVNTTKRKSVPYNAAVVRVGFDPEAPAPKLTFKPVGFVNDAAYAAVRKMAESQEVMEMLGLTPQAPALPAPEEVAEAAVQKARAPAEAPTPAPTPAPKPQAKPKAEAPQEDESDAFSGLGGLGDEPSAAPAPAPKPASKPAKAAAKPAKATPAVEDDLLAGMDEMLAGLDAMDD